MGTYSGGVNVKTRERRLGGGQVRAEVERALLLRNFIVR